MDEIVNQVAQKVNLPPDKAREVVNMVVGFIKGKLPAPIASQVDGFLHTGGPAATPDAPSEAGAAGAGSGDMLGDAMKGIGDMFGGTKG